MLERTRGPQVKSVRDAMPHQMRRPAQTSPLCDRSIGCAIEGDSDANIDNRRRLRRPGRYQPGPFRLRPGWIHRLARVQGELDAARSTLETMRTRVQMSRLDVTYQAAGRLAPDSAIRPVADALHSSVFAFMSSLGAVILFVAAALPPLALIVPTIWLIWAWRRRVRAHKAASSARTKKAEDTPSA